MVTPKSVQVLLVRHGQAQSNVSMTLTSYPESTPMPLTPLGRNQARVAANQIVNKEFILAALFASPLTRTQETATIISENTGIPIVTDVRLRETDFGIYNNEIMAKLFFRYPHPSLRRAHNKEDELEGLEQVRQRAKEFLQDLLIRYAGQTVVVVSHADVIREILGLRYGLVRYAGTVATASVHTTTITAEHLA